MQFLGASIKLILPRKRVRDFATPPPTDVFTEDPTSLKTTAKKLERLLANLAADPHPVRVDALTN